MVRPHKLSQIYLHYGNKRVLNPVGIWEDPLFQQKWILGQVKAVHPKTGATQLQTQVMANYDKNQFGMQLDTALVIFWIDVFCLFVLVNLQPALKEAGASSHLSLYLFCLHILITISLPL